MNTHFTDTLSNGSNVTRISLGQPVDAHSNLCLCARIAELRHPRGENFRFVDG
jgi:hypothetical protein